MRKGLRAAAAVVLGLLTWAWSDVLLWGHIFERGHLDHVAAYDAAYQAGHQAVLVGLILLGAFALWSRWSLWYSFALWTLAYGGWADALYYWLDGRSLPATLPWLDKGHPLMIHPVASASLLTTLMLWTVVDAGLWLILSRLIACPPREAWPRP